MSLLETLLKTKGHLKAEPLSGSVIYQNSLQIPTVVPILNVALSGTLDGGLISGITTVAGPSRHFKSTLVLILAKAYLDYYDDAVILFYDSEHGMTPDYFKAVGIDPERVVRVPVKNVEDLKFDVVDKLTNVLKKGDHAFIMIDSIGNLASKKEVEDAKDAKVVADMTRAKAIKSLHRIITPEINELQIPYVQIAHTYKTQETYSKDVVGGGTGLMFSSDTVLIIGRSQEKEGKELTGYNFNIIIEKSRFVKERSKLVLEVSFEGGVKRWSGLEELAVEGNFLSKRRGGSKGNIYTLAGAPDKDYFKADLAQWDFWSGLVEDQKFKDFVEHKYKLVTGDIMSGGMIEGADPDE